MTFHSIWFNGFAFLLFCVVCPKRGHKKGLSSIYRRGQILKKKEKKKQSCAWIPCCLARVAVALEPRTNVSRWGVWGVYGISSQWGQGGGLGWLLLDHTYDAANRNWRMWLMRKNQVIGKGTWMGKWQTRGESVLLEEKEKSPSFNHLLTSNNSNSETPSVWVVATAV